MASTIPGVRRRQCCHRGGAAEAADSSGGAPATGRLVDAGHGESTDSAEATGSRVSARPPRSSLIFLGLGSSALDEDD